MRVYSSYSTFGFLFSVFAATLGASLVIYAIAVIHYGTLAVPVLTIITTALEDLNSMHPIAILFRVVVIIVAVSWIPIFCISMMYQSSYYVTDEGIGFGRRAVSKSEWTYAAYAKWEDITAIEYKRTIGSFGTKLLILRSRNYTNHRNLKSLAVPAYMRDFKEILSIVREKTNLSLQ